MIENMKHWDALKTTDPKYTKKVEFGRKFTSINSQWQLQQMTAHFGPVGHGWGYRVDHTVERINDWHVLAIADVTIWTQGEDERHNYGPVRGMATLMEPMRKSARDGGGLVYEADGKTVRMLVDDDAGKKAMTDALTKGLSHLGLSADVFLGLFDDNKYVSQVREQFASGNSNGEPSKPLDAVDPADRGLVKNGEERSQYEVNKRKEAEGFVGRALETFSSMHGTSDITDWYKTPISPKGRSTNRDAVDRLKENFPDLGMKLETAADEVRLRNGARLQ